MNDHPVIAKNVFDLLEGTWQGQGRGGYPTINAFDYREKLVFTRKNETPRWPTSNVPRSAWMVRMSTSPHTGRMASSASLNTEIWNWSMHRVEDEAKCLPVASKCLIQPFACTLSSKTLMNDTRMISSARAFELEGDQLRYEMAMSTTKVDKLTQHLAITLERVRK